MILRKCTIPAKTNREACSPETDGTMPGCIHLPVAPACNIQCRFCARTFDGAGEGMSTALSPQEAVEQISSRLARREPIAKALIFGPGESLANAASYVVLRRLSWLHPELILGIETNGLLLRDRIEQIVADGVRAVSITINALSEETAKKIYSGILYKGRRYPIEAAAEFLLKNQWQGLMLAVDAGLQVSVRTIVVPGVNEEEVPLIAGKAGKLGAVSKAI